MAIKCTNCKKKFTKGATLCIFGNQKLVCDVCGSELNRQSVQASLYGFARLEFPVPTSKLEPIHSSGGNDDI